MFAASLLTNRFFIGFVALVGVVSLVYFYGQMKYREGAKDTVAEFIRGDLRNATQVKEKAREVLDSISSDADPDELLRATGGLRD